MVRKRDLKKELKFLYGASAKNIREVDVPVMNFLMIDGEGDPNDSPAFGEAAETLFALSYTLKFAIKKGDMAIDYGVMPLEALWWADDMKAFSTDDKSAWKWTAMIMQPGFIDADMVAQAMATLQKGKNPAALPLVRFETFDEGHSAQILHIGPFSEEGPTISRLHAHIDARTTRRGRHHEIYLSDIRRAAPQNWRTILRQPMF